MGSNFLSCMVMFIHLIPISSCDLITMITLMEVYRIWMVTGIRITTIRIGVHVWLNGYSYSWNYIQVSRLVVNLYLDMGNEPCHLAKQMLNLVLSAVSKTSESCT